MTDAEKSLTIMGILSDQVVSARNVAHELSREIAVYEHVGALDTVAALTDKWKSAHRLMIDAEELCTFATRCFIERANRT